MQGNKLFVALLIIGLSVYLTEVDGAATNQRPDTLAVERQGRQIPPGLPRPPGVRPPPGPPGTAPPPGPPSTAPPPGPPSTAPPPSPPAS